jgi:hypothetical protein
MNETASKIRLKIENVVEYNISQKAFLCSILENYAFWAYHQRANNYNGLPSALFMLAINQMRYEDI